MNKHRERILQRILLRNFKGVIVSVKEIIIPKIAIFDYSADITMEDKGDNVSTLYMDYGEFIYSFDLHWEERENGKFILKEID